MKKQIVLEYSPKQNRFHVESMEFWHRSEDWIVLRYFADERQACDFAEHLRQNRSKLNLLLQPRNPIELCVKVEGKKITWKAHYFCKTRDMSAFAKKVRAILKTRSKTHDVVNGSGWAKFPSEDLAEEAARLIARS